ncbi:excalibur calcium-binding domain-containing protein [Streptomyces sp. NBC_01433]|uniref:excalibur calcium-binding domain-containing protein n=1 Tax=Streptomyces sp. NBC_01433 TaxID=2903864 RepID=UPI00224FD9B5|nr:excalibur calcium-binding domain-containing protein [Streptomyces sp. NBC_01433]MCX4677699.1 excalibur calcium-binding domain-containing protein [Streptomyces sp. NBC_01433]
MKDKVIYNVIAFLLGIAMLCLLGGGLWWGATAAYSWFDNWARGEEVRHEWHLRGREWDVETASESTSGGQVEIDVLREVYVEDANDPDGAALIGDWDSNFEASGATVKIAKPPKHGTATVAQDGTLTYKANGKYVGTDSVTWSVKLKQAPETVTGTQLIAVNPEEEKGEPWVPPGERWPGAYENCTEARAEGGAPVRKGQRGYAPWLDADSDGIGCDGG